MAKRKLTVREHDTLRHAIMSGWSMDVSLKQVSIYRSSTVFRHLYVSDPVFKEIIDMKTGNKVARRPPEENLFEKIYAIETHIGRIKNRIEDLNRLRPKDVVWGDILLRLETGVKHLEDGEKLAKSKLFNGREAV